MLLDAREGISYPDGFQDSDGTIYMTYDYRRSALGHIYLVRFTESDVLRGELLISDENPRLIYEPGDR